MGNGFYSNQRGKMGKWQMKHYICLVPCPYKNFQLSIYNEKYLWRNIHFHCNVNSFLLRDTE